LDESRGIRQGVRADLVLSSCMGLGVEEFGQIIAEREYVDP
jgi:hypothetical protein